MSKELSSVFTKLVFSTGTPENTVHLLKKLRRICGCKTGRK